MEHVDDRQERVERRIGRPRKVDRFRPLVEQLLQETDEDRVSGGRLELKGSKCVRHTGDHDLFGHDRWPQHEKPPFLKANADRKPTREVATFGGGARIPRELSDDRHEGGRRQPPRA